METQTEIKGELILHLSGGVYYTTPNEAKTICLLTSLWHKRKNQLLFQVEYYVFQHTTLEHEFSNSRAQITHLRA